MLERFRAAKKQECLKLADLKSKGRMPVPLDIERPSFAAALQGEGLAAIAEYKRASPSRGNIELGLEPEDVAASYAAAGAGALSVLTETVYFKGDLTYLDRMQAAGLPLLRKDFLFDPLQIERTAATPASALLLIVRMFENANQLRELVALTHSYGLEAVVEIFDERELDFARQAGAQIIQVNNRNLDTLKTDLAISERLVQDRHNAEIWIAASGISKPEHVHAMDALGFDAVLVGTALMQGGKPEETLRSLLTSPA